MRYKLELEYCDNKYTQTETPLIFESHSDLPSGVLVKATMNGETHLLSSPEVDALITFLKTVNEQ